uniref:Tubulin alpha chain n=1 Tax=Lygus hesperus TaxID=30085 RepID=A0A0A9YZ10_LYGHE
MGGGTGSGLNSRVIEFLTEEFPKQASVEVGVFPSPKVSTAVVEPYNTILATHATMGQSKCVVFIDNEAIYNICNDMHDVDGPTNRNLNNVLSQAISAMTTGLRFDCRLMTDFFDFQTNLIPYPRLHFPVVSLSPIVGCQFDEYWTVNDITSRAFESSCRLANHRGHQGTHMACCLLYRVT